MRSLETAPSVLCDHMTELSLRVGCILSFPLHIQNQRNKTQVPARKLPDTDKSTISTNADKMSISDMTEQSIIKNGLIEKTTFQEDYIFDIEAEIKMKIN